MRRSRIKSKREYKTKSIGFIVLFVLLLLILSISLGHVGAKYFILPHLVSNKIIDDEKASIVKPIDTKDESTKNAETNIEIEKKDMIELEGMDIFSIQVGSFSTEENAKILTQELSGKGMGSYIWYNDRYKVLTISLLDRESIDGIMSNITHDYEEAFVVTTSIPTKEIKCLKEDSKYMSLIKTQNKELIKLYKNLSQEVKEFRKNTSEEKNNVEVKEDIKKLKDMKEILKESQPSSSVKVVYNEFSNTVEKLIIGLESAQSLEKKEKILKIQNTLMESLYQYIKTSTTSED